MDPNNTLATARVGATLLAEAVGFAGNERDENQDFTQDEIIKIVAAAETLATAFEDLDRWMSRGGFLPTPWATQR